MFFQLFWNTPIFKYTLLWLLFGQPFIPISGHTNTSMNIKNTQHKYFNQSMWSTFEPTYIFKKVVQNFQKLPKKWLQQFLLQRDVCQNSPKVTKYLGNFCKKICFQELQKIAQSSQTECDLHSRQPLFLKNLTFIFSTFISGMYLNFNLSINQVENWIVTKVDFSFFSWNVTCDISGLFFLF